MDEKEHFLEYALDYPVYCLFSAQSASLIRRPRNWPLSSGVYRWVVWAFGMVLVMTPIIMFPRRGGVEKGKSFVHTTRLVNKGIYGVVRHPQYLGGIFAIFMTTLLWYPHWLFGVLGVVGTAVVYMGCREEEQRLIQQFGDDYIRYMQKVPRMNFLIGIIRLLRRRKTNER